MTDTAGRERRAAARTLSAELLHGTLNLPDCECGGELLLLGPHAARCIHCDALYTISVALTLTDAASAAAGSVTLSVDQADDCLDAVEQVVTTFAQAGYREDHGAYTAFRELAEYLRNAIAVAASAEASGSRDQAGMAGEETT